MQADLIASLETGLGRRLRPSEILGPAQVVTVMQLVADGIISGSAAKEVIRTLKNENARAMIMSIPEAKAKEILELWLSL